LQVEIAAKRTAKQLGEGIVDSFV